MSVGRFPVAALPFLRCPVCAGEFSLDGRSLRCGTGHSYDIAHHGYVNLLPGDARPGTADTAEMVAAREAFLAAGHFAGLRDFVCGAAESTRPGGPERAAAARLEADAAAESGGAAATTDCVVEVGAGTGYYLAGALDRLSGATGLALDISKFAARRAARAHERMASVVCNTWQALPIADGAAALVLDVFAPRNPSEFRRVLRPGGGLLVVTPTGRHLRELVEAVGLLSVDQHKPERLEQALAADFSVVTQAEYEERLTLPASDAAALAAMGPSAHHLRPSEIAGRLASLGATIEVTLSVKATTFVPRTAGGR